MVKLVGTSFLMVASVSLDNLDVAWERVENAGQVQSVDECEDKPIKPGLCAHWKSRGHCNPAHAKYELTMGLCCATCETGPDGDGSSFSDPEDVEDDFEVQTAPTEPQNEAEKETVADELLRAGSGCSGQCRVKGNCSFCGSGQCCSGNDWWRGVPDCELAMGQGGTICGNWRRPHPKPKEFRPHHAKSGRLKSPRGFIKTSRSPQVIYPAYDEEKKFDITQQPGFISNLTATKDDHILPRYIKDGGQPWSKWEMVLVRDMIVDQIKGATAGTRDISAAKIIRLNFHDCLKHKDGKGGCDGCLNWNKMGTNVWGDNTRAEDRYFEDHEREPTNIGLHHIVEFLEYIYTFDFGMVESGCWNKPGGVTGGTLIKESWVSRPDECRKLCDATDGCEHFTVPDTAFVGGNGPCRLINGGKVRKNEGSSGRLIGGAGTKNCDAAGSVSWSLASRKKSRADLWAFAGLVALEESIDRQNKACDGNRKGRHDNGQVMCVQKELEEGCKVIPSRPFVFQTGRQDCMPPDLNKPYISEEEEVHPDEHFNGTMTVEFMEENFGFNAKETVAIMGAHTLGKFTQKEFGHKYLWTIDFHAFNNQYYRNVAGRDDWFFDDQPNCTKVGDAWGNKGKAIWIAKMNQVYRSGGPIQWIQKKVVCPNCADKSYERGGRNEERLAYDEDCCKNGVPEGAQCRPDGPANRPPKSRAADWDDDHSWGCEYSHFIFGRDETALSVDFGLMWKFDVDLRGFPSGCPGLETFKPSLHRFSDVECGIDGRGWFSEPVNRANNWTAARDFPDGTGFPGDGPSDWTRGGCPADCGKQDYRYKGDNKTLSEHFEAFADDQALWIEEFIPAYEKMLANGYMARNSKVAPQLIKSWPLSEGLLLASVNSHGNVDVMRGD